MKMIKKLMMAAAFASVLASQVLATQAELDMHVDITEYCRGAKIEDSDLCENGVPKRSARIEELGLTGEPSLELRCESIFWEDDERCTHDLYCESIFWGDASCPYPGKPEPIEY